MNTCKTIKTPVAMAAPILATALSPAVLATCNNLPAASVRDAIAMARIQHGITPNDGVATVSADGTQAVLATLRGDLARNTNDYELRLVDLRGPVDALAGYSYRLATLLAARRGRSSPRRGCTQYAHWRALRDMHEKLP